MASAFSHALVAIALGKVARHNVITWRVLLVGVVCSILPDIDIIGFRYGIQYGDLWGHRGLTHSIFFAGLLSVGVVVLWNKCEPQAPKTSLFIYFFLSIASHGVLDAMTDGGLGVAFFSPFDTTRYFFTFRPVAVSPIGIGPFFDEYGLRVLASEAKWLWFPTVSVFFIVRTLQRIATGKHAIDKPTRSP